MTVRDSWANDNQASALVLNRPLIYRSMLISNMLGPQGLAQLQPFYSIDLLDRRLAGRDHALDRLNARPRALASYLFEVS